ncbi:MAG: hypothetical protein OHK0045_14730 [Raineya sp.]
MKQTFLTSCFFFTTYFLFAQSIIEFNKETHDFGTIEEGTNVTYDFIFKNKGKSPLVLQSVEPSCGCTTPAYTKEPILPGKTGKITVSYNSQGRPNTFHKSITVRTNSEDPVKVIYIKGFVNPKTPAPASLAVLSLDKYEAHIGNLQLGQTALQKFTIRNIGAGDLTISNIRSNCNCVNHNGMRTLKPGESFILELRYTPRQKGNIEEEVMIYSNDSKSPMHKIKLKANVIEASLMKENVAKNPFGF